MALPTVPDTDDRRKCSQCTQIGKFGPCQAPRNGSIVASRNYEPDRNLLRRCEGYRPDRTDPDQRPGSQRWPGLNAVPATKTKEKKTR